MRFLLKMPSRWMVALAGGKPTVIEGRTLDPRIQFLGAAAKLQPAIESLPPVECRKFVTKTMVLVEGDLARTVDFTDIEIPGDGIPNIKARVYRPWQAKASAPVLVYYHMGGCVLGDLDTCHVFCSHIAERGGFIVVSVDYRLAPEHKFPAAVDDAITSFRWVRDNARSLGGSPDWVGVGGDSAGGYLVAVISQEMRRLKERGPSLQMMIYPAVVWRMETPSMTSFGSSYPLNTGMMYFFRDHYFGNHEVETLDFRGSPGLNPDLRDLPPALIYGAGHDPLVDQGRDYAEALRSAGVPVHYRCYDSLGHCFTAMSGAVPAAGEALVQIIDEMRDAAARDLARAEAAPQMRKAG
ncbi:MAG: alpha/beta hydrolase [Micropepsaceae bacterium]